MHLLHHDRNKSGFITLWFLTKHVMMENIQYVLQFNNTLNESWLTAEYLKFHHIYFIHIP
jgi:hypothetical protein